MPRLQTATKHGELSEVSIYFRCMRSTMNLIQVLLFLFFWGYRIIVHSYQARKPAKTPDKPEVPRNNDSTLGVIYKTHLHYYCKCWVQDNDAVSSQGHTENTAATHPTEAASSDGGTDTSISQACQSIYGHYGCKVDGTCLSHMYNTAQLVWSMLAHSVAAWEMQHRPGGVCSGEGSCSVLSVCCMQCMHQLDV